MGKQVCGVKLMSPGGREVAPSGDEKEDAGPGLLTLGHCCMAARVLLVVARLGVIDGC